jgi:hypothetical protein
LNPLRNPGGNGAITQGNLYVSTLSGDGHYSGTTAVTSGKWYAEFTPAFIGATSNIGLVDVSKVAPTTYPNLTAFGWTYLSTGNKANNSTTSAYGASWVANDVIGVAYDADAGTVTFYKNGTSQGQAYSGITGDIAFCCYDGSSANYSEFAANFGQRPFAYTPPAGFRALNTNNLPTPSIVNGANFMAAKTYTGTGVVQSISNAVNNVSFQPDLVWIKSRTPGATNHALFDSSRGVTKYLSSNTTTTETTLAQSLTALNADGFSLGTDTTLVNASANSYVAWQWRESITAGLDIVTYTGNGANRTIAHNLGVAPAMVIVKRYDAPNTGNWQVRHTSIAAANSIQLNATSAAAAAATVWNSTAPTSSVFSVGTSTDVNATGGTYAAYCFAEIAGFSKFGSYTGNGSADGPFVFCGFRPRFVMVKAAVGGVGNWVMHDSTRSPSNAVGFQELSANSPGTEPAGIERFDFTANGFKVRSVTAQDYNISGVTYIFMAFAEVPSKYALAR